jgi:hypothetical protein
VPPLGSPEFVAKDRVKRRRRRSLFDLSGPRGTPVRVMPYLAKHHIPHEELEHGENANSDKRHSKLLAVHSEFLHPQRSVPAVISTAHRVCNDGFD